jgi:hypothetical protein
MKVARVITKTDLLRFLKLPYQLYKDDPSKSAEGSQLYPFLYTKLCFKIVRFFMGRSHVPIVLQISQFPFFDYSPA